MTPALSRRTAGLVAYSYEDFPVEIGDLDLRGDNSPPLSIDTILRESVTEEDTAAYGPVSGEASLRQALADLFGACADQVIVTAGASEALHLALTCLTDPGDAVHLPRPAFPGYDQLAHLLGLRPLHYEVPGPPPGATSGVKVRVVCSPHNPSGVLARRGAMNHDLATWTVWDLCHMPLAGTGVDEFRTGMAPNEVVVFSLSKLLRLPGARVGCLVAGSADLIATATTAKTHLSMSTSRLSQHLAARVLTNPSLRKQLAVRHTVLADLRRQLQDAVHASKRLVAVGAQGGTHLLVHANNGDAWRILKDAGVVGLPGAVFNSPVPCVRLCTAQPADVIAAAAKVVGAL